MKNDIEYLSEITSRNYILEKNQDEINLGNIC